MATAPKGEHVKFFKEFKPQIEKELAKVGYDKNRPVADQTLRRVNSVRALTFGIVFGLFILFPSWYVRFVAILPPNIEQDIEFPILEQTSLTQKLTRRVQKKQKKDEKETLIAEFFPVYNENISDQELIAVLKKRLKEKEEQIVKLESVIEGKDLEIHNLQEKSRSNVGRLGAASKQLSVLKKRKLEEGNGDDEPKNACICSNIAQGHKLVEIFPIQKDGTYIGKIHGRTGGESPVKLAIFPKIAKNSEVSDRQILNRSNLLWNILGLISGSTDASEVTRILKSLIRNRFQIFREAAMKAGKPFLKKLSGWETLSIKTSLNMTNSCFRNLKAALIKLKADVFASEYGLRKVAQPFLKRIRENSVREKLSLVSTAGAVPKLLPCFRVNDLQKYIGDIVSDLAKNKKLNFQDRFNDQLWIIFSGDKGGSSMKFTLQILNSKNVGSVFNVKVYALYEGLDNYGNMAQVSSKFFKEYLALQNDNCRIGGHGVKVFLGGDFKFLYTVMGHQGASATYPSLKDTIHKDHLASSFHKGEAHTPENCKQYYELRQVSDYMEQFSANLLDEHKGGTHVTGKHHESIAESWLLPIKNLNCIVPPILHILLGITLKIYVMLLGFCRAKDAEAIDNPEQIEKRDRLSKMWEDTSEQLLLCRPEIEKFADDFVDFVNIQARFAAGLKGDYEKVLEIAENSDDSIKEVDPDYEKCFSHICVAVPIDSNVNWFQCDTCSKWCHFICQGISSLEEEAVASSPTNCFRCRGVEKEGLENFLSDKRESKAAHQTTLHLAKVKLESECDRLKGEVDDTIGPFETHLVDTLSELKVDRQVYHGNSFIGNHCKILLSNIDKLLSVLDECPIEQSQFKEILTIFDALMKLCMKKSFLSQDEIDEVGSLCNKFGEKFPLYFPEESILPKMHELIFHIPRFVQAHGSLGLFSEEEGESLHAVFNNYNRQLACVRDSQQRFQLLVENQELSGVIDRTLAKPRPRNKTTSD